MFEISILRTFPLIALPPPAGAFGRGPEDHQRGEEEEERDDPGDRAPVRRLHHAGLHGRQPAQKREELRSRTAAVNILFSVRRRRDELLSSLCLPFAEAIPIPADQPIMQIKDLEEVAIPTNEIKVNIKKKTQKTFFDLSSVRQSDC